MSAKKIHSRISVNPKVCNGKPVITNTRVLISVLLEWIEEGHTFKEIVEAFPSITAEDVKASVAYARDVIEGERYVFYSESEISAG